ncbi:uncharacterized protein RJT21DRAFT_14674 [Scheffersomyces amazonensis]|uniref:uncharacterized protein n=1 Tax=Scheffersomyces amazonensis TaxID=1078765 RepID=UPI00315CE764
MRFFSSLSVSLLAVLSVSSALTSDHHKESLTVYELNSQSHSSSEAPVLNQKDSLLYLADKFDVSDHFKLGNSQDKEELIKFIDSQHQGLETNLKPNLFILIRGIKNDLFSDDLTPTYQISGSIKDSYHLLFKKFPKILKKFHHKNDLIELTNEIKLISPKSDSNRSLVNHFKYFNDQLVQIWQSFTRGSGSDNEILISKRNSQLKLINDKMFINELSQLIHLNEADVNSQDILFIELNSLISIAKKIGSESSTFKFSGKILKDYLQILSKKFNISILVPSISNEDSSALSKKLNKRSNELNKLFQTHKKRQTSDQVYFASEESCQTSTNSCEGHGECIQVGDDNSKWLCSCSSTFNKSTQKTTVWTGYNCGKKDISAQANLLLWSSLALLLILVGGVQLLISMGNEPLPGVLEAATIPKKNL